jgi:amino acid adenylation domain-containing protein
MEKATFLQTCNLIDDLRTRGLELRLRDGALKLLAPKGAVVSEADRATITASRDQLIQFLELYGPASAPVPAVEAPSPLPPGWVEVSPGQKRIWMAQAIGDGSLYHLAEVFDLVGPLDVTALAAAFQNVVQRHSILRTIYKESGGELLQKIIPAEGWNIQVEEASATPGESTNDRIDLFLSQPFDLRKDFPLRVLLIPTATNHWQMAIVLHHIAGDGWSLGLLASELSVGYRAILQQATPALPVLPIQYVDYAQRYCRFTTGPEAQRQTNYWTSVLKGSNPASLPADFTRPAFAGFAGANVFAPIDGALIGKAKEFAAQRSLSLFTVLIACWKILLWRYCREEDVCVGTPVANRNDRQVEPLIGYFSNTITLRSQLDGSLPFTRFAEMLQGSWLEAMAHAEVPLEAVAEAVCGTDGHNTALFQTVFVWQNESEVQNLSLDGVEVRPAGVTSTTAKFDLTLALAPERDGVLARLEYRTDLFTEATARRLLRQYRTVLRAVLAQPQLELGQIQLSDAPEELLLHLAPANERYRDTATLVSLFEEQVEEHPGRRALRFNGSTTTYNELNQQANHVALALIEAGIRPGQLVPVILSRSAELVAAILGILKAGGAYVPIDPTYPEDRIRFILRDTRATLAVTGTGINLPVEENSIRCIEAGNLTNDITASNPARTILPEDLAYVIYTSGSTGQPKGVLIEHRNVVQLLFPELPLFDFNASDIWTLFHSASFDFSVWEIFGPLTSGACLVVVADEECRDFALFAQRILTEGVTVLNQTPGAFYLLKTELLQQQASTSLRYVIFGGEALNPALLRDWHSRFADTQLINMYGITETTVHVTFKQITALEIEQGISNIGRPLPTLGYVLLDQWGNPVPEGIPGELHISGLGLARGYLYRPELTEARFTLHTLAGRTVRLYKTGDLARQLAGGHLEYLGRIDDQVKVRGHRIETAEIEHCLARMEDVRQAVVVTRHDPSGQLQLVAYVAGSEGVTEERLLAGLRNSLPAYMVPSYLVILPELPLTSNGKIDRRRLPDPVSEPAADMELSFNPTEMLAAGIWKEVLGSTPRSLDQNFFEAGGDSIKAIRMIGRLKEAGYPMLTVANLYANPTISLLSSFLEGTEPASQVPGNDDPYASIRELVLREHPQAEGIEDVCPMTDIQKGMVFSSLAQPEQALYHDQFLFTLPAGFDRENFRESFALLVSKHEALRTSFDLTSFPEAVQIIWREVIVKMPVLDLGDIVAEEMEATIGRILEGERKHPFDLATGPLWRWQLLLAADASCRVLFQCHHSILDGWSVASLFTELNQIYARRLENAFYQPASLPIRVRDAVQHDLALRSQNGLNDFWVEEMRDYKRLELFETSGRYHAPVFRFPEEQLADLMAACRHKGFTLKAVVLAAYAFALNLFTGEGEVTAGLVVNRRPELSGGDQLLGCYLNTLPVRLRYQPMPPLEWVDLVSRKLAALKTFEGLTLADIARVCGTAGQGGNPFFDAVFNYIDFHVLHDISGNGFIHSGFDLHPGSEKAASFDATNTFLNFTADASGGRLKFRYVLQKDLRFSLRAEELHAIIVQFLNAFVKSPGLVLSKEQFIPHRMRETLYRNGTSIVEVQTDDNVVASFIQSARSYPDAPGLACGDFRMAYAEWDRKANQVAHYLLQRGVGKGSLVAVLVKRSPASLVSIMGILKAGAAFVPIDPAWPERRRDFVIGQTGCPVLFSDGENELADLPTCDPLGAAVNAMPSEDPHIELSASDSAYVIYTSGSTGQPKGVVISHGALIDHVQGMIESAALQDCRSFTLIASLAADAGHSMFFSALKLGASVHLISEELILDGKAMSDYIVREKIDCIKLVPSLWLAYADGGNPLLSRRCLVFGGEAFSPRILVHLRQAAYTGRVYNHYGPTETSIGKLIYPVELSSASGSIPMGRPFSNTVVYVADVHGEVCPPGVAGELCIGGKGLADGYLHAPGPTEAAFVQRSFRGRQERFYRTGDRVAWTSGDVLEFQGRNDDQIKVHGQRIEPGEIEAALLEDAMVRNAIVMPRRVNDSIRLVAYVVPATGFVREKVVAALQLRLPPFMIPHAWVLLEQFPINSIGKLDRSALPLPVEESASERIIAPPRNSTEAALVSIWEEVLQQSPIGIHDNFFELGGHSLIMVRIISQVRRQLGESLPVTALFEYPTIARLSDHVLALETAHPGTTGANEIMLEL